MLSFADQIANETTLREAWHRVQSGGRTPGVDGVTVDGFRRIADERLRTLSQALTAGTYRPAPAKRIRIPKSDGGWRALGVSTILDRVAQTAAAAVLSERVAAVFSGRSFAYRPFLGPRRAALYLRSVMASASWVVTTDIAKFFDNVDHHILASQLRAIGIEESGIQLILRWLTAPVQDGPQRFQPVKGLPQGSPVSPLLANLYLSGFDAALEVAGFQHVRYADDFVVLVADEHAARRALAYVSGYLTSHLRLAVKPAKTQFGPAADGFQFVGFWFTRDTWTIPPESIGRFRESVNTLLSTGSAARLVDVAKAHNDLIRGWRNYYGGNSTAMDAQLAELNDWRTGACRGALSKWGVDPETAGLWLDRLIEPEDVGSPAGTYAYESERVDTPLPPDDALKPQREQGKSNRPGARAVHDLEIGRQQEPVIFEDGWLRVPTFGAFVARSHALVVVRRKKHVIFECPLDDLKSLSLEADGVVISTTLIDECARRGVPVSICRLSGRPVARVLPATSPLRTSLVQQQLRARQGRGGSRIVLAILRAKLSNQRALLLYHHKYSKRDAAARARLLASAAEIACFKQRLDRWPDQPLRTARADLFLVEARAAAHYWSGFAALIPADAEFLKRTGRGAADVVNKLLNYGYALLMNQVWLAVHHAGLEPTLGLLHSGRRQTPGLVFDLMEPFRQPVVDRTVLSLIGRHARLALNRRGELSLRTRRLLQRGIAARLATRSAHARRPLALTIQHDARALRHALLGTQPFRAYGMTW